MGGVQAMPDRHLEIGDVGRAGVWTARSIARAAFWTGLRGALVLAFLLAFLALPDLRPDLRVSEAMITTDVWGDLVVVGAVENASPEARRDVRVEITLTDSDGVRVARETLEAGRLDPGAAWAFTWPVPADGAARVRARAMGEREGP